MVCFGEPETELSVVGLEEVEDGVRGGKMRFSCQWVGEMELGELKAQLLGLCSVMIEYKVTMEKQKIE